MMSLSVSACSFYADFGPLNLSLLFRYCCKLNKKLKVSENHTPPRNDHNAVHMLTHTHMHTNKQILSRQMTD